MAISFVNATSSAGTGNGVTLTEPTGTAQNDVLIAYAACDTPASTTLTSPTGWTDLFSGSAGSMRYRLSYIVRGASAPSLTWGMSASTFREAQIISLRGVDTTTPIEASTQVAAVATASTNVDPPSVTTLTANAWVVAGGIYYPGPVTTWTAPGTYTIRGSNAFDGIFLSIATTTAGATDPGAVVGTGNGSGPLWSFSLSAKPAAGTSSVTAVRVLSYDLLNAPKALRVLSYDLLNATQAARQLSYNLLNAPQATRQLSYDLLNAPVASRQLAYDVIGGVQVPRIVSYDLIGSVQASRAIAYDLLGSIVASRQLAYDLAVVAAASSTGTLTLLWAG